MGTGSYVEMKIHLPDGTVCNLQGTVTRSVKTNMPQLIKNGMGIKLHRADPCYVDFVRHLSGDGNGGGRAGHGPGTGQYGGQTSYGPQQQKSHVILSCTTCGAKNKIPRDKLDMGPKCGKCKSALRA